MTINELEEFQGLSSEVQAIKAEIDNLYNPYCSPNGKRHGGHSNIPSSPTEQAAFRIIEKKESLEERREAMAGLLESIEDWLSTVDDAEIRSIIRWHYLLNLDWRRTCLKVYGYPSYDVCKKRIRRYFGLEN